MLPAARITDNHVCPMFTGVVPHVGGPILPPAAATVLVGKLPAARIGDMVTCVGPPDVIATGVPTILISKMPAARLTDLTAHGGVIVVGCPMVLYDGAAPPTPPPPPPLPEGMTQEEADFMRTGKSEANLEQFRADKAAS